MMTLSKKGTDALAGRLYKLGDTPVSAFTIRRGLQEMTKKDGKRLPNIFFCIFHSDIINEALPQTN